VKNYKKLTEIKPDFEIGYWLWGECLKKNGQHVEAIALYEKHITDSRDSFGIHSYGKCLMEVERYDEALKQFERLIDIHPEYNPVYLSYGQILEIKGDKENALLAYLKHIKLGYEDSAGKFNFKKIYKQHVIPLLNKLESKGYVKQFYGSENKKISDIQLSIILILLSKYDVVNEHIQNTIKVNLGKTDEKKKEFEILIFTIKLSSWLKLIDENLNDALKSTDLYIEYIKALKTIKERENEVMNFSLDLFSIQIKYNIKTENVRNVLKRLEDVEEIPFSNVIFKVWTCLSDPDSVEAQRYLNEKPIAEVVKQLKERVKSQKRDKNHCKDNVK
jgi:tetratricopeptide (TPR) repeat protein